MHIIKMTFSKESLEKAGRTHEVHYQVALQAEKTGGLFTVKQRSSNSGSYMGFPQEVVKV